MKQMREYPDWLIGMAKRTAYPPHELYVEWMRLTGRGPFMGRIVSDKVAPTALAITAFIAAWKNVPLRRAAGICSP